MYNINLSNIKKQFAVGWLFIIFGIFMSCMIISIPNFMDEGNNLSGLLIFPLIFIIVGLNDIRKLYREIKRLKSLSKNGILIKNLPYKLENSNLYHSSKDEIPKPLPAIAVDYKLPDGTTKHLIGEPRYDGSSLNREGLVDLLIDPNNLSNYYIGFNITQKH